MRWVRALGAFLYEFVVGEDPLIALVIAAALGAIAALAAAGINAWWLLPLSAIAVLTASLSGATRR